MAKNDEQRVKDLETALAQVLAARDEALAARDEALKGVVCVSCAAQAAEEKAAEEKAAEEKATREAALGKIEAAKERRLKVLDMREKNRAGVDPYQLGEERMKEEEKHNSELRKLNLTIQGVDPLA